MEKHDDAVIACSRVDSICVGWELKGFHEHRSLDVLCRSHGTKDHFRCVGGHSVDLSSTAPRTNVSF